MLKRFYAEVPQFFVDAVDVVDYIDVANFQHDGAHFFYQMITFMMILVLNFQKSIHNPSHDARCHFFRQNLPLRRLIQNLIH